MQYNPADEGHFLNSIPIGQEVRNRLGELSPESAFDLLARRRSAKEAFDAFVGIEQAESIARALESALSPSEREALAQPPPPPRRLGARTDPR